MRVITASVQTVELAIDKLRKLAYQGTGNRWTHWFLSTVQQAVSITSDPYIQCAFQHLSGHPSTMCTASSRGMMDPVVSSRQISVGQYAAAESNTSAQSSTTKKKLRPAEPSCKQSTFCANSKKTCQWPEGTALKQVMPLGTPCTEGP